jgi:hypothetical protein
MAGPGWGAGESPLLSGLFGAFQTASAFRQDTATLWSTLRVNAATWQFQAQGGGAIPSQADLEAQGRQILHDQGVGLQQVNTYRAIANQWRTAKANLHQLDMDEQIENRHIFQPPWAQTAQQGVPDRYRVRVEWEVEPIEGDSFTTWGSYEVDSPLTSLQDILDQAGALVGNKPSSDIPVGAEVKNATDYELEQI